MKVRLAALSIALVASASTSFCPAFAGPQEGGMRFKYAPNVFPLEQPRIPQNEVSMGGRAVHPAMEGKVPHGPSFLGVDPNFLRPAPRPAPVTSTQVAKLPSIAPVSIQHPFSPNFGAPSAPPQAALPKQLPSFGTPSALPQSSSTKAVAGKLMPHKSQPTLASKSLNGKLLPRKHAIGQPASALALKPIESYGKNFGYTPGSYLPVSSGNHMNSKSDVYGKLLTRQKH
jgi:hypothetical protein